MESDAVLWRQAFFCAFFAADGSLAAFMQIVNSEAFIYF